MNTLLLDHVRVRVPCCVRARRLGIELTYCTRWQIIIIGEVWQGMNKISETGDEENNNNGDKACGRHAVAVMRMTG